MMKKAMTFLAAGAKLYLHDAALLRRSNALSALPLVLLKLPPTSPESRMNQQLCVSSGRTCRAQPVNEIPEKKTLAHGGNGGNRRYRAWGWLRGEEEVREGKCSHVTGFEPWCG